MSNVKQPFQQTKCPLCQTTQHDQLLYPVNFNIDHLNSETFSARRTPDRVHYETMRCQQCGIVRAKEVLDSTTLASLYQQSHSNDAGIARMAASTYGKYFKRYLGAVPAQARILEVGSGAGFFLTWLMEQGFHHVQGVEPSREAVHAAGTVKPLIYNGMFDASISDAGTKDVICAFHVFDHLLDPLTFLQTSHRLLVAQGVLMMVMHDINAPIAKMLGRKCPMIDIEHPFLYNKSALNKLMQQHGFKVIHQFDVVNNYPLSYWAQMAPLPKPVKDVLAAGKIGNLPISMALGNQGIIAVKQ